MFSGEPKYQASAALEDHASDDDEDDDEVEGVEMPPPKELKPKLPAALEAPKASSSGRLIPTTLDHFWQRKPQRELETTPTNPAPTATALSEPRDQQHKRQVQSHQQSIPGKAPAGDSPTSDYSTRRTQAQEGGAGGSGFGDDGFAVVLESPVSTPKRRPKPRPSVPIGNHHGGSPAVQKPFSKRDLLRPFEETDSDSASASDQLMQEAGGPSGEEDTDGYGGTDGMEEDSPHETSDHQNTGEGDGDDDDAGDELIGIGSRRIPGFSQNSPPQQLEISGTEEDSDSSQLSELSELSEPPEDGVKTPTSKGVLDVDLTPRRSMANLYLLEEDPDELERQEEEARQEIVRKVLNQYAEAQARNKFEVVVVMPKYEDVADYLYNPDEWEAVAVDWRCTRNDGNATYQITYRDGHTRVVEASNILDHIEHQILEDFENDLFDREENPETWYYPELKQPGGAFAGGTGITSGVVKKRGRRTEAKILLDNSYKLGTVRKPEVPLPDDKDDSPIYATQKGPKKGTQDAAGVRGPILASQYDKFDIIDSEILASIEADDSSDESWDDGRRGKGKPRGRPSTSTRAQTTVRVTRAAARRARGRPPLTPTRGTSTPTQPQDRPAPKSNVVKASATSRGRGRPRGSKNTSRMETPASSREDTPASFTVSVIPPSTRGRPKGPKNIATSNPTNTSLEVPPLSEFPVSVRPITPIRPLDLSKLSTSKPSTTKSEVSTSKRALKPTRSPKPPGTPSGARGPGRPSKTPKQDDDLVEQTTKTTSAKAPKTSASSSHRRTLSTTKQTPTTDPERPTKRRRIRFGRDGPEEVSDDDSPPHRIFQVNPPTPSQDNRKKSDVKPQKPMKPYKAANKSDSDSDKKVFRHEVDRIINKMLLDGAPAYHVQLCSPSHIKPTMWVRLENLQSKEARRKVREFEAELIQRETEAKLARDRINAQLQRDRQRLAEREAQILGTKNPGKQPKTTDEEERKEREKEEQRQREKIARRLALQETLFAGT
ncbi:hypothetical protein TWF718_001920 [Orbilia javanica]|uniref:Uncharacterized protein n=1 Tax=Orbilia javanica TaxID=47235 RepID=A0AAN8RNN9_9PEZI